MKQYLVRISRHRDGEMRTNEFAMHADGFDQAVRVINARIAGNREGMPDSEFEIVAIRTQGLGRHIACKDGWRTVDEIAASQNPTPATAEADTADSETDAGEIFE